MGCSPTLQKPERAPQSCVHRMQSAAIFIQMRTNQRNGSLDRAASPTRLPSETISRTGVALVSNFGFSTLSAEFSRSNTGHRMLRKKFADGDRRDVCPTLEIAADSRFQQHPSA